MREFIGKMPQTPKDPKTAAHTVCEPAQSKYTWTFHKSHFIWKFTRKMLGPTVSPARGHIFCASLRARTALGHFTRATLYGNL